MHKGASVCTAAPCCHRPHIVSLRPPPFPPSLLLPPQLSEAQALAGYSAGEMAELVQQLAEARAERGEAAAKLAEAREEVSRLRSGEAPGIGCGGLVESRRLVWQ